MSEARREYPFVSKDRENSIDDIVSSVKRAQRTIAQQPFSTRAQLMGVFDLGKREDQSDE